MFGKSKLREEVEALTRKVVHLEEKVNTIRLLGRRETMCKNLRKYDKITKYESVIDSIYIYATTPTSHRLLTLDEAENRLQYLWSLVPKKKGK